MQSVGIGPVRRGSVAVASLDAAVVAYQRALDLEPIVLRPFAADRARDWGRAELAGSPTALLGAVREDPATHWLELVEVPGWRPVAPFGQGGWLALEILVADVRGLAQRLVGSPFRILGEPRPLALSEAIWAMQVAGPSGEVLYLTEVRAAVPPFDLPPPARWTAERLFIPVVAVPDREAALAAYRPLCAAPGWCFDTRVGALQRALQLDPDQPRAVATLPLAGQCLLEIDQVPELFEAPIPAARGAILAVAAIAAANLARRARPSLDTGAGAASTAQVWFGPAGECLELIEEQR